MCSHSYLPWAGLHTCALMSQGLLVFSDFPPQGFFFSLLEQGSAFKEELVNAPFPCVTLVFPAERL